MTGIITAYTEVFEADWTRVLPPSLPPPLQRVAVHLGERARASLGERGLQLMHLCITREIARYEGARVHAIGARSLVIGPSLQLERHGESLRGNPRERGIYH